MVANLTLQTFRIRRKRRVKSEGFVLLLIVLTLLAISGAILFTNLGAGAARTEQQNVRARASGDVLLAAKLALIGYLVSPPGSTFRPGVLPIPDSYGNSNYDGMEDPACLGTGLNGLPVQGSASTSKRCLGKFPWKAIGFDLGIVDGNDPTGRVPWLAVSANVVSYDDCLRVLNSDSATLDSPLTPSCSLAGALPPYLQPTTLPHPWLTVVNENGSVLSNRVAAVLIMPGAPTNTESRTQQRSPAPGHPGQPSDYLDDIKIPLGCLTGCTNYDNAGLSNVFVDVPPGAVYPTTAADTTKRGQKVPFNDLLIYVTIDEVMPYLERRVVGEMSKSMKAFKASGLFSPSTYPWMSPFVAAPILTTSLTSGAGTIFGMLPFMSDPAASSQSDYGTDFDWALTGFTETLSTACRRISSSPSNRWVRNTLTNSIAAPLSATNIASGTVPLINGVCQWRGTNRVSCSLAPGQSITTTFQQSMTIYSNNTCTTSVGPATLTISRAITSLILDVGCVSPTVGYTAGTAGDVHRWSSACASMITGAPPPGLTVSSISLAATDTVNNFGGTTYSLLPTTVTVTLVTPIAGIKQVVTNRMRYHPKMPGWFHENLWYQTAFAAVAPAAAPVSTPCTGGVTTLTAGARQGIEALVIQSGPRLAAVNPGTRPSMAIADYLEGQNPLTKGGASPGMTNCTFDSAPATPTALANDQLLVVSP